VTAVMRKFDGIGFGRPVPLTGGKHFGGADHYPTRYLSAALIHQNRK
jgi:hypothetical protein